MSNNVVTLNYEIDEDNGIIDFMGEVSDFCEVNGVDITTPEFRHQAAVIMTQLQSILMGVK